ncbi:unnamed protein product [Vicia faba]|uniref:Uncharacterized protein n=1 Tax=Vicia faba TaxID=3906 RepID=A0AAV0ZXH9_VICFA|nr:unnamed protein product [Vicia faba]
MINPLDTSCNGDLKAETSCSVCTDVGFNVTSQLVNIDPKNSSKCFYFSILYAIGIVNQFGPTDPAAAACILGAIVGVVLAFVLIVMYKKWDKMRRENLYHRSVENSVRDSVLPNTLLSNTNPTMLETCNTTAS